MTRKIHKRAAMRGAAIQRRWWAGVAAVLLVALPAGAWADGPPSATGAGHTGSGDQRRTFSFSAVARPDGSGTGNAQLYARAFPAKVHMRVTCLRVEGNIAYISGLNTNADPDVFEGIYAIFAVEDNGEGRAVDRVTQFHPAATQNDAACLTESPSDFFPIEQGNVQVRG
jgi:hypothetical protein